MSYASKTVLELKALAKDKGLRYSDYGKLRKAELIELIRSTRGSAKSPAKPNVRGSAKPNVRGSTGRVAKKSPIKTNSVRLSIKGPANSSNKTSSVKNPVARSPKGSTGRITSLPGHTKTVFNKAWQDNVISEYGVKSFPGHAASKMYHNIYIGCVLEILNPPTASALNKIIKEFSDFKRMIYAFQKKHGLKPKKFLFGLVDKDLAGLKRSFGEYSSGRLSSIKYRQELLRIANKWGFVSVNDRNYGAVLRENTGKMYKF